MGSFIKESWLTILISVVSGFIVAGVYSIEKPYIEQNARDFLNGAVLAVVPGGAKTEAANIDGLRGVHKVLDASGRLVGWGVEAEGPGFQGNIRLVIGLDPQAGKVTGLEVLDSSETPGLGDNIKTEKWRKQFGGKPAAGEPLEVVKVAPSRPYHVHAITAATISSNSVVSIVNKQVASVRTRLAEEASKL